MVSIVSFDPSEVGGGGAALEEVSGLFKEVGVLDTNPSNVFPGV